MSLVDQMFHQEDSISHQITYIYIYNISTKSIVALFFPLLFFLYDFSSLTVRISVEHRMSNAFAFAHTRFVYIHIWEKKAIINTRENKAQTSIRPRPWTKVSISKEREREEIQNLHIYNRLVRLTRSPPFIMIINSVLST